MKHKEVFTCEVCGEDFECLVSDNQRHFPTRCKRCRKEKSYHEERVGAFKNSRKTWRDKQ